MSSASTSPRISPRALKRGVWAAVILVVVAGIALGTRVVPNDDPLAQGTVQFDPATFGSDNFPKIQDGIAKRAVDITTLATAITADPKAAASKYAVQSSGGQVYSVTFTGVVGEGTSGIYKVAVAGFPDSILIRMQTGPAINGTDLRDALGDIKFGQFKNQIEYQNAGSALNEQLKSSVLSTVDAANLTGKTVTVTGVFTLINPAAWLITPSEISVS